MSGTLFSEDFLAMEMEWWETQAPERKLKNYTSKPVVQPGSRAPAAATNIT